LQTALNFTRVDVSATEADPGTHVVYSKMSNTAMTAQMATWLVAAVAATAAAQAAQFSRFNFPFSMFFMHVAAAWLFARAAVLLFNMQLDLGDLPAQQAPAAKQDTGPSKQKQLMIAGLLLGSSMATQALVQDFDTGSGTAAALFKVSSNTASIETSLLF
jgi:hypothetical protein